MCVCAVSGHSSCTRVNHTTLTRFFFCFSLFTQACLTSNGRVVLPPGLYRISAPLLIRPGGSLTGMVRGC